MKKIIAFIGARPQFIKHAPIELALKDQCNLISIHTGQHYDKNMSEIFFEQLALEAPFYKLNVGSHSHGKQTGMMLEGIEKVVLKENPDIIVVYGDTNSTLAGALVGAKLQIPVAHIEAGLRSFNRAMPEEINRIMTDHISSLLFAPTDLALQNLSSEGIQNGVIRSGDIMYDMLLIAKEKKVMKDIPEKNNYYLATIHRPYNTDNKSRLINILEVLDALEFPVQFPVHPRTWHLASKFELKFEHYSNLMVTPAVSYFQNLNLMANAKAIITDSGGMQKEAYFLRKKCITIRPETEWIETLHNGWNELVFDSLETIPKKLSIPPGTYLEDLYGDGSSAIDIAGHILHYLEETCTI